jgi:hypothetical protein
MEALFIGFSFVLAGLFISRYLLWGSSQAKVSSTGSFGRFFQCFSFDFGSRIYMSPPIFDRHALPSRVSWRFPPLPPQAPVVSVVGDQRVVYMRLGALCSLVRMWSRSTFFRAVLGGIGFSGVGSSSGWVR